MNVIEYTFAVMEGGGSGSYLQFNNTRIHNIYNMYYT